MRIRHLAMALMLGWCSSTFAATTGKSIAINFGADEPSGQDLGVVSGAAGVAGTVNWNNLRGASGFPGDDSIVVDANGAPVASNVTVEWTSNNSWSTDGRGEDTNNAPDGSNDRALMLGYLDTSDTSVSTVTIDNIPADLAGGYDVFLYVQNGVLDRGGTYTVTDTTGAHEQSNVTKTIFDGSYKEGAEGNYLLFKGLKGNTLQIDAQATDTTLFRGPLNAVEICAANACTALPNAVAGRGTIGNNNLSGKASNLVFGPSDGGGAGLAQEWYAVSNPGNKDALDAIFTANSPVVPAFRGADGTWWTGSSGAFGSLVNYPSEVQPQLTNGYSVRLTGEMKFDESGTYRFADGVDDYTYFAVDLNKDGVAGNQANEVLIDDNTWTTALRDGNTGGAGGSGEDGWEEVAINVAAGGEWRAVEFDMAEGTGGDSGVLYWDYNPNAPAGSRIGGGVGFPDTPDAAVDGADAPDLVVPESHLRAAIKPLVSGQLDGKLPESATGWIFDVNASNGQTDAFVMSNPKPAVYHTSLDVSGSTFYINAAGNVPAGTSFHIIVADAITGTPTIGTPGWTFNGATGMITFGAVNKPGDFNGNGTLDAADIDALSVQVNGGTNPAAYDLNNDHVVDAADRDVWVNDLKKTYYGDADLNGQFDSDDFVQVFIAGEYEDNAAGNSTWGTGDWDGDGDFTSSDFVTAFVAGGYEAGPRAAVSAVPEPSSLVLLALGLGAFARRRR